MPEPRHFAGVVEGYLTCAQKVVAPEEIMSSSGKQELSNILLIQAQDNETHLFHTHRNIVVEDPRPTLQHFMIAMEGVEPYSDPEEKRDPGDLYGILFQGSIKAVSQLGLINN